LFIGPLPTFPENLMQIRLEVFVQSCEQTNNDDYISSLVEVMTDHFENAFSNHVAGTTTDQLYIPLERTYL